MKKIMLAVMAMVFCAEAQTNWPTNSFSLNDTSIIIGSIESQSHRLQIGAGYEGEDALIIQLLNITNVWAYSNIFICAPTSNIVIKTTNMPVVTRTTNGWIITFTNK